jgi:hypothetical protein
MTDAPMLRARPDRSQPQSDSSRFIDRWIVPVVCIFLAAITWLVFAQTLGHEFFNFDDKDYVYENTQVRAGVTISGIGWAFTGTHAQLWHPLTSISHMLDCQLFGLQPGGHHFVNVLLHTIAVILLFFALRAMTDGPGRNDTLWRSAFVATLFAIHPLRVESVAWVAERKDVLSGVFFMLTLLAYVFYTRKSTLARYLLMSILFACGLMSKASLVTVPCLLLLLDYWPLRRMVDPRALRRVILEKLPLLALSIGSAIVTTRAQAITLSSLESVPMWWRIQNSFVSAVIYIWQMFWPVKLAPFYPHPLDRLPLWMVVVSIALIFGISLAALIMGRKRGYIPAGWFWYLGMLVPMLGLVQVGLQGHADRFTYLPQIGLYVLFVWAIADLTARWRYRGQVLSVAVILVISALAWRARIQTGFWHDSEKLWRHTLAVTTANHVAHGGLADVMSSQKRVNEALEHFQDTLFIRPDSAETQNKIGLSLLRLGNPSAAISHWKMALEYEPGNLNAESNLAWVFATCPESFMRDGPRALKLIRDVIQHSDGKKNPLLLRTLAAAYAESGRFTEAINTAQEASVLAAAQGNSSLASDLEANIADYRLDLPVRDPSFANVHPVP